MQLRAPVLQDDGGNLGEQKKDISNGEDLNFNNLTPAPTSFKFGNLLRISQQSILLQMSRHFFPFISSLLSHWEHPLIC